MDFFDNSDFFSSQLWDTNSELWDVNLELRYKVRIVSDKLVIARKKLIVR